MNLVTVLKERYEALDHAGRRTAAIACCLALALLTAYALLFGHLARLEARKTSREQTLAELLVLQQRHKEASAGALRLTNRLAAVTPEDTPVLLIEQSGIVTKGGVQSKPLPRREQSGVLEEGAEITIAGLSANELINLLHRLEQHQKPVAVRRFVAKTRFNEPARLDAVITLSLLRPAPAGERK
ncbi:hypothetical protein [Trichlorobacter ammonificans]|uniref:General secretion pathway protein M n=1 Tax=Trichlorobacter ammonificans TaxID=2916410 RepID=A0ABM9D8K8_9BACT|nr:hypothetical protein [Trichlorobacter ammonificans]CAH2031552.1 conserved protein of unknown function [Trichlorobacter ammonificans]